MNVLESLAIAVKELASAKVRYALVGGLAVSVRTEPRFTRDADLAVAVASDAEAETVIRNLLRSGFRLLASLEQETTGRLATVRLIAPSPGDDGAVVDFLFASSGIETEVVDGATVEEIAPGILIPVASTPHLIAMKLLSERPSRPQDAGDLLALLGAADSQDLETVSKAIELIANRGAGREKDLQATFRKFIALAAEAKP